MLCQKVVILVSVYPLRGNLWSLGNFDIPSINSSINQKCGRKSIKHSLLS